ncbi:hypothetical protein [uncultured Mediterranean phage uvMED]|nr:hypothetical protein [uncultured Mediterranean phage uvMED]
MKFKDYIEDQINTVDKRYFVPDSYQAIAVLKRGFMKELCIQIRLLPNRVLVYLMKTFDAIFIGILFTLLMPLFIATIPFIPLIITTSVYFRAMKVLKKEYKKEYRNKRDI